MTRKFELNATISNLVDGWCERRAIDPLRYILPNWPLQMGLTDDTNNLLSALKNIRTIRNDSITDAELELVEDCIQVLEGALENR